MAASSLDLRKRVVRAWDAGMDAESGAAKYEVSRAWVHRLVQRRRETGSIAPRKPTTCRRRVLAGQEARLAALITARPYATLAELRDVLPTSAAPQSSRRAPPRSHALQSLAGAHGDCRVAARGRDGAGGF